MATKPIPDGYHTATPYLIVKGGADAIEFYRNAFGAEEVMRMNGPGGAVMHAEIKIGDSPIMLADEMPDCDWKGPQSLGGTPVSLMLYVEDVDARYKKAIQAGAKELRPVKDQFYGDRAGTLADPFGHVWTIATHKEDVPGEEINRRFEEMMKQQGS
ncbi:MAG: VOC family protein [Candidatus Eisenbacteria bacterium]|nr:VOC family protein [Candidatus Latescibacterota bacterium]MBD3300982.1 VOC family protein [Candidatus Eisenbacteria bacterium]